MKNSKTCFVFIVFCIVSFSAKSQILDSLAFEPKNSGPFPKKMDAVLNTITVSGYYRFLGCFTQMKNQYPEFGKIKDRLFLGDDSNIPQLMLTIGGRPNKTTSFSTDLYLWTPLTGSQTDYVKGLNLGVNLTGSHSTKFGTFTVRTGGIHWYTISPFTFASNTGYNRFSVFERNPWDPAMKSLYDRYHTFYSNGALTQDTRWGQQAFQGVIIDGLRLPKEFSFAYMYGKSQFNGGALPTPNTLMAGKIKKEFKNNFVSLNGISSKTFKDSLAQIAIGYNLFTTEFKFKWKEIQLSGEVGSGNYYSPIATSKWGEALDIKLQFTKEWTHFPLEVRYFQISPNVINNNGVFWNSSIQEYNDNFTGTTNPGSQTSLIPFASSLVSIGQMTNNRRGLILNMDMDLKKHKFMVGYSAASEIVALSNKITYGHPANNLALSRFWRWSFPASVGPYGNLNKIYRGVYETVQIKDSITAKGFNSLEISYKTEFKVFGKDLLLFYLGGFHSVQSSFSALPRYSQAAYLQSYNNQLEFYYLLFPKVILSNYFGYDRIIANQHTALDADTKKAKNQEGISYAIGLDVQLAKNTGLYLKHRWMTYQDFNFSLDKYNGTETTVELKIYF
jgi:hypothetical protein